MRAHIHDGQEHPTRFTDRPDTLVQDPTPLFRSFPLATHHRSIHLGQQLALARDPWFEARVYFSVLNAISGFWGECRRPNFRSGSPLATQSPYACLPEGLKHKAFPGEPKHICFRCIISSARTKAGSSPSLRCPSFRGSGRSALSNASRLTVLSSTTRSHRPFVVWMAETSGKAPQCLQDLLRALAFDLDHHNGADGRRLGIGPQFDRESGDGAILDEPVDPVLHRGSREPEDRRQRGNREPRIITQK